MKQKAFTRLLADQVIARALTLSRVASKRRPNDPDCVRALVSQRGEVEEIQRPFDEDPHG